MEEDELYLKLYLSLREEATSHQQAISSYLKIGLTAIGAVAGYALYSETLELLSLIPLLLVLVMNQAIEEGTQMLYCGSFLARLERQISKNALHFRWEREFGFKFDRSVFTIFGVEISQFRITLSVLIVSTVYVISSIIAVEAWIEEKAATSLFHIITIDKTLLTTIYVLLGVLCILSGLTGVIELKALRSDLDSRE